MRVQTEIAVQYTTMLTAGNRNVVLCRHILELLAIHYQLKWVNGKLVMACYPACMCTVESLAAGPAIPWLNAAAW